jgi:hypothetical protein
MGEHDRALGLDRLAERADADKEECEPITPLLKRALAQEQREFSWFRPSPLQVMTRNWRIQASTNFWHRLPDPRVVAAKRKPTPCKACKERSW